MLLITGYGRMSPGGPIHKFFTFFAMTHVIYSKFCKINIFIILKRTLSSNSISDLVMGAEFHFGRLNRSLNSYITR